MKKKSRKEILGIYIQVLDIYEEHQQPVCGVQSHLPWVLASSKG